MWRQDDGLPELNLPLPKLTPHSVSGLFAWLESRIFKGIKRVCVQSSEDEDASTWFSCFCIDSWFHVEEVLCESPQMRQILRQALSFQLSQDNMDVKLALIGLPHPIPFIKATKVLGGQPTPPSTQNYLELTSFLKECDHKTLRIDRIKLPTGSTINITYRADQSDWVVGTQDWTRSFKIPRTEPCLDLLPYCLAEKKPSNRSDMLVIAATVTWAALLKNLPQPRLKLLRQVLTLGTLVGTLVPADDEEDELNYDSILPYNCPQPDDFKYYIRFHGYALTSGGYGLLTNDTLLTHVLRALGIPLVVDKMAGLTPEVVSKENAVAIMKKWACDKTEDDLDKSSDSLIWDENDGELLALFRPARESDQPFQEGLKYDSKPLARMAVSELESMNSLFLMSIPDISSYLDHALELYLAELLDGVDQARPKDMKRMTEVLRVRTERYEKPIIENLERILRWSSRAEKKAHLLVSVKKTVDLIPKQVSKAYFDNSGALFKKAVRTAKKSLKSAMAILLGVPSQTKKRSIELDKDRERTKAPRTAAAKRSVIKTDKDANKEIRSPTDTAQEPPSHNTAHDDSQKVLLEQLEEQRKIDTQEHPPKDSVVRKDSSEDDPDRSDSMTENHGESEKPGNSQRDTTASDTNPKTSSLSGCVPNLVAQLLEGTPISVSMPEPEELMGTDANTDVEDIVEALADEPRVPQDSQPASDNASIVVAPSDKPDDNEQLVKTPTVDEEKSGDVPPTEVSAESVSTGDLVEAVEAEAIEQFESIFGPPAQQEVADDTPMDDLTTSGNTLEGCQTTEVAETTTDPEPVCVAETHPGAEIVSDPEPVSVTEPVCVAENNEPSHTGDIIEPEKMTTNPAKADESLSAAVRQSPESHETDNVEIDTNSVPTERIEPADLPDPKIPLSSAEVEQEAEQVEADKVFDVTENSAAEQTSPEGGEVVEITTSVESDGEPLSAPDPTVPIPLRDISDLESVSSPLAVADAPEGEQGKSNSADLFIPHEMFETPATAEVSYMDDVQLLTGSTCASKTNQLDTVSQAETDSDDGEPAGTIPEDMLMHVDTDTLISELRLRGYEVRTKRRYFVENVVRVDLSKRRRRESERDMQEDREASMTTPSPSQEAHERVLAHIKHRSASLQRPVPLISTKLDQMEVQVIKCARGRRDDCHILLSPKSTQ